MVSFSFFLSSFLSFFLLLSISIHRARRKNPRGGGGMCVIDRKREETEWQRNAKKNIRDTCIDKC